MVGVMTEDVLIGRASCPDLNAVLGYQFKILDDGFIRVIDYMGDDAAIVQSARISYGAGTKSIQDDRGLIRYLMRHRHTSPFEQNELKIHVRVPMDTWRQWIRHRMASVNEYSTRYSEAIDSMQTATTWRMQSGANRQGSGDTAGPELSEIMTADEKWFQEQAQRIYHARIKSGIAREQARKDLPLSTYTEAYWKVDLHNLLHFLSLRMDSHAQLEIREYANVLGKIVRLWCPLTWEAFLDFRLNSMQLSATELACIKSHTTEGLSKREITELDEKLKRLGLKE